MRSTLNKGLSPYLSLLIYQLFTSLLVNIRIIMDDINLKWMTSTTMGDIWDLLTDEVLLKMRFYKAVNIVCPLSTHSFFNHTLLCNFWWLLICGWWGVDDIRMLCTVFCSSEWGGRWWTWSHSCTEYTGRMVQSPGLASI